MVQDKAKSGVSFKSNIDVSVIIPIYNVEKYILKCIRSVVDQTFKGNIEILLIDDKGNDKSVELASEYLNTISKQNIEYKIIRHATNLGLSAARNTGVKQAGGDMILFLDSDDILMFDAISNLYTIHEKYPEYNIIEGSSVSIDENDNVIEQEKKSDSIVELSSVWKIGFLWKPVAWNKLIDRKWYISNNISFEAGIYHEDLYWSLLVARSNPKIITISNKTYCYRQQNCSITHTFTERHFESSIRILNLFVDFFSKLNFKSVPMDVITICENYRTVILDEVLLNGSIDQKKRIIDVASHCAVYSPLQILNNKALKRSYKFKSALLSNGFMGRLFLKLYYRLYF